MVGRTYSSDAYRYGFNGKENDNEVKGESNQQDYGMRIYDPRLGKFLSVDPLNRDFPYYSPYHFAGCSPIKFIDLDGGEPKDYVEKWTPRPIGFARSGSIAGSGTANSLITVSDPLLGWISVELVYDQMSDQNWFVHKSNSGKFYYFHADDGQHNVMRIQVPKNGLAIASNGGFVEFETANAARARIGREVATGLAAFWSITIGGVIATNGAFFYQVAVAWLEDTFGIPLLNSPDDFIRNRERQEAERRLAQQSLCFVAGTKVLTKDSLVNIEKIAVGDSVWAFNDLTYEKGLKKVISLSRNVVNTVVKIEIDGQLIWTTPEHPFWVNNRWKLAGDLRKGDSLLGFNGEKKIVDQIIFKDSTVTVYNFTVVDYHSYYVSKYKILVHNNCPEVARKIKYKGFRDGSLLEHFEKHGPEFGDITQSEYLKMAKSFAAESGESIQEKVVGNIYVKYDKATRRTLIANMKDREIRTFYKADFRDADPFEAAVEDAYKKTGKTR